MEAFEYHGYWWLPDDPESKVPSILRFDSVEGTTLDLLGALESLKGLRTFSQPDLILSVSPDARPITL